ncbi:ribonuclease HI [Geosmithia morbida]|uniref:Ribonuclease H n=1 Tax=Geosmithia morbida TaxID=1094350 RepID=A0A9P4YW97_9HYPO|nr:ribonuclease HI [Geosmithia morbida]KAF4123702.1 ribonuclease HI [Geosmithia morbida]
MTNVKKRSAGSSLQSGPTSQLAKKRKLENLQKFYAVKVGRIPGVYLEYSQCQAQTAGFKGAVFKSFTSREDAEAFAAGRAVQPADDEPAKFYAVAVGNPTGIFSDWADASKAIKGVKGPKYKRFASHGEAVEYIKQYGGADAIKALGLKVDKKKLLQQQQQQQQQQQDKKDKGLGAGAGTIYVVSESEESDEDEGSQVLKIWTDGSSRGNGRDGARAGLGVFFGQGDPRNVSEPLRGDPQTNQRAELMAMQRALEVAPQPTDVEIISDSQYSINCVTQWAVGWKAKGWKTALGEEVKNQDIIRAVLALIDSRNKAGGKTTFTWVKGHAKDPGNTAADLLAVKGASMG